MTELKPLLIRGDRLLLALDVFACWAGDPDAPPHFSRTRVDAILRRYYPEHHPDDASLSESMPQIQRCTVYEYMGPWREVFRSMRSEVAATTPNIAAFVAAIAGRTWFWTCHCLFEAFASGELTERDFQDP
ncbi:hypothetical protein HY632_04485 [Candidatus Uhrbacteria bacterium]|nr:hypothetical protein [Candidatus Uhrbacteria bacterium]